MSKPTKKVAGDRHIAGENNGRFFEFITMTMLENEVGARYQPHHDDTFVDFGSDRRSDSYVI